MALDRFGNRSTPSAGSYDVENVHVTTAFTTHVCDPARTGCPKDVWDAAFSLDYPAIAKLKVEWFHSTFSSNYAGDVAGLISSGDFIYSVGAFQRYWTGTAFEYDFGRPVFSAGNSNRIGGGLGHLYLCINKDCPITPGTAEADVTVTVTYPQ